MESRVKERRPFGGLLCRRPAWVLTWRGRLLLLVVAIALVLFTAIKIPFFLSLNAPISAEGLVVEGWVPDYALVAAIAEFKRLPYGRVYVTGGPLEMGAPLSEYKTYAELSAATLIRLGLNEKV